MQSKARPVSMEQEKLAHEQIAPLFLHDDPWNILRLYHVYRLALASIFLLSTFFDYNTIKLGSYDPNLFLWVAATYVFIALLSNLTAYFEVPELAIQSVAYAVLDIIVLLMLLYSSGGIGVGLGILLVIPVLIPYLCAPSHYSIMLASLTGISLVLIEVQLSSEMPRPDSSTLTHSAILAMFILLASWLGDRWIRKASAVASLAQRRGIDLANLSQLNQSILDRLESGIMVVEPSGVIRHMNAAAWDLLGNPGNWRSKPLTSFAPELDHHLQHWLNKICPRPASFDIRHQHTTELRARFTQMGTHSRLATLISIEDTREQREKLQGVKLASLGQLTASIAHEIRNPLGAISHAAQLLSESKLDKADRRLLQIIQSNTKRMNVTIESVLNLSRKKNPKRERLLLKPWLNEFLRDFLVQSHLEHTQVTLEVEPNDTAIDFDPAHLHQVLWNLCRNALKYAHDNPRKLQLDIQGGTPTHTRDVMLNIIDNGKGIPEDLRQRLFEPFFTTSTKGTGLGLFMTRELCLSNGATLEYLALPTGGSCFRIVFSRANR